MAQIISKDLNDGNALFLLSSSNFKKDSTFDPNCEYVVMQNKKILGITGSGTNLTAKNAVLNDTCFPGLQYSGFLSKKVDAGIWCLQKEFSLPGTIKFDGKYPFSGKHQTKITAAFEVKFKLVDTQKAFDYLRSQTNDLWYPVSTFKKKFIEYSEVIFYVWTDVLLKKNGNLPAQIRMNLLSKEFSKSEDLRYFDDFKKWMQDEYGKYGYEVEVNLSM